MKKVIAIIIIFILLFGFLDYKYTQNKRRDITYTVEKYMTGSFFNVHKMYSISSLNLTFSDSKLAVVDVAGLEKKAPHKKVSYKVMLEKKRDGTWKVKRVYSTT